MISWRAAGRCDEPVQPQPFEPRLGHELACFLLQDSQGTGASTSSEVVVVEAEPVLPPGHDSAEVTRPPALRVSTSIAHGCFCCVLSFSGVWSWRRQRRPFSHRWR
jgi:hypothetical protein